MAYTTINKSSDYFNTVLYTGTGSSQSISVGFRPDLNWIKDRTGTNSHGLFDSVRNAGGTPYELRSNATDAQSDFTGYYGSIDSTGFTVITGGDINTNGNNYVAWNWLANGAGSSNTDGSITSTVSASTTSGFSIVTYTGTGANATVGHGLGVAPKMMLIKHLNAINSWRVYHNSLGATNVIYLNLTDGTDTGQGSVNFNNTAPTSSVFSLGTNAGVNASGGTYVAYCFAEKKGFSKFGSYTGNGSSDGTFVYLGFKPAFVIIKNISTGGTHWRLADSARYPNNLTNTIELYPSTSAAESTNEPTFDFLSNGFKLRGDTVYKNSSGDTYIYMAFAEHPLVSSTGTPCTAR